MARDRDLQPNPDQLTDEDLRALVRQRLTTVSHADTRSITVEVHDGTVHIQGRVGTEMERRVVERELVDGLGLPALRNEVIVDPIAREQYPRAADDAEARSATDAGLLGDAPRQLEPSTETVEEDLDSRLFGTHDVQDAIRKGLSYSPPDAPTPEGRDGTDPDPETGAERH